MHVVPLKKIDWSRTDPSAALLQWRTPLHFFVTTPHRRAAAGARWMEACSFKNCAFVYMWYDRQRACSRMHATVVLLAPQVVWSPLWHTCGCSVTMVVPFARHGSPEAHWREQPGPMLAVMQRILGSLALGAVQLPNVWLWLLVVAMEVVCSDYM